MLVAMNQKNERITLIGCSEKTLAKMRKESFRCPCCKGKVMMKAGRVMVPHFAHLSKEECAASEPESVVHLQGKKHLFRWLSKQGYNVQLEMYFPAIKQRADLYIEKAKWRFAFEFQCSLITSEEVRKRTLGYKKLGIRVIWILNADLLKNGRGTECTLSSFQWSAAFGTMHAPRLFFYSPHNEQFTILQHIIPFSSRQCFCNRWIKRMSAITLYDLLNMAPDHKNPLQRWHHKKLAWRINACRYADYSSPFFTALYETNIAPATLPLEIGIPVPGGFMYETHCVEWQFWLYRECMSKLSINEGFHRFDWRGTVVSLIKQQKISLRLLPGLSYLDAFWPADMYLEALVILGILQEKSEGFYVFVKPLTPFHPKASQIEQNKHEKLWSIYSKLMKNSMDSYTKGAK
ncbi:competence protein CoiA [Bacillus testis]|uniref:competence protein CoiA n=1 Tax=Bacillus testis TaxID=1622072 RepID=UPI00067ED092|nr:competence protein CoiA family protein [Bacillus testis]